MVSCEFEQTMTTFTISANKFIAISTKIGCNFYPFCTSINIKLTQKIQQRVTHAHIYAMLHMNNLAKYIQF